MRKEKLEALIEDLTRVTVENLNGAIKSSGNAINHSVPRYVGSEAHVTSLVLSLLREMNAHGLFIEPKSND